MKTLNKLSIIIAFLLIPFIINAQTFDERQRETSTIIADALDQLPADDMISYYRLMNELCLTNVEGLQSLALMLRPVEQADNSKIEYALDGLSHFVTNGNGKKYAKIFSEALSNAIKETQDVENKRFLISLYKNFGTPDDIQILEDYLLDKDLASTTMMSIIAIPRSSDMVKQFIINGKGDRTTLAYAAAELKISDTEDVLISWLNNADQDDRTAIYYALSQLGGEKSLEILKNNAKIVKYQNDPTDATNAYINIVENFAIARDTTVVVNETKVMLKTKRANVKIAALNILVSLYHENATPTLIKYVKDKDIQVRNEALRLLTPYTNDEICQQLVKVAKKNTVKTDVVRWMGENKINSQIEYVTAQLSSKNDALVKAAICATVELANENELVALFPLAKGEYTSLLTSYISSYEKSPYYLLTKCIREGDDEQKITALSVLNNRKLYSLYGDVFELFSSQSTSDEVRMAAYAAFKGVVRIKDINVLQAQLVRVDDMYVKHIQDAFITLFSDKSSYNINVLNSIINFCNEQSLSTQARFYPVLACLPEAKATNIIVDAYNNGINEKEALQALLTINNANIINTIYDIAKDDELNRDILLDRYVYLVKTFEKSEVAKITLLKKALDLNPNDETKKIILKAIETTNSYQGIMLAANYLDNPNLVQTAANVILNMAYRNPDYNGKEIIDLLESIKDIFNDSDAVYKKAQIEEHLTKIAATPIFTLSEEEAKEGFEILFDGTNLDKWNGDKTNYIVKNGNIYVTANYGNDGNLYTEKEYADFIYRFEFSFMRPGVNNGVGIRTPMNVDAAYEGMEIQILDHDAPIYAGLREYQVHGSVYGVIPATRVVFPELGTWNTEEIYVKGDYVKVTLNNQVILEGNIRKACQGHNMAPDGSNINPYTVDKHNHPGLFNKKGYISFCGHGEGLLIRNVRIKEL